MSGTSDNMKYSLPSRLIDVLDEEIHMSNGGDDIEFDTTRFAQAVKGIENLAGNVKAGTRSFAETRQSLMDILGSPPDQYSEQIAQAVADPAMEKNLREVLEIAENTSANASKISTEFSEAENSSAETLSVRP